MGSEPGHHSEENSSMNTEDLEISGSGLAMSSTPPPSARIGPPHSLLGDRLLLSQLSAQITSRIMIKLDQINLKVNQISDRLYELERKLENVDSAFDHPF